MMVLEDRIRMVAIDLRDVRKEYQMGETIVEALRGSDLHIRSGAFIAIMGPSGSGKSTLMNMIGALDVPTSGEVTIGEDTIAGMEEDELAMLRSRKVGFIFQQFNLIESMTARENVALPMLFRGVPARERNERAADILEQVGLGDRVDFQPSRLSGGQRQRVSIARALANDPDIILADEPTGNLDTDTGDQIMELLTELNEEGKTIVMVTHDPHDAEYAHRIVNIVDGVVQTDED